MSFWVSVVSSGQWDSTLPSRRSHVIFTFVSFSMLRQKGFVTRKEERKIEGLDLVFKCLKSPLHSSEDVVQNVLVFNLNEIMQSQVEKCRQAWAFCGFCVRIYEDAVFLEDAVA